MKRQLKVGDIAPTIQAIDLWGNTVNVPAKDKWIFLSFHRFAACPFCNLRTNELVRNYHRFKQHNIEVISVWPSDKEKLLRHAGKEKTPFPILSDKSKSIYQAYGVTASSYMGAVRLLAHPLLIFDAMKNMRGRMAVDADPNLMPAGFLISPDGSVQMAHYGKHFGDHPKMEAIFHLAK